MKAYTISKLAKDAGVSVHMVRNYELRGLIHFACCTPNGYRIYNEQGLQRLKFVLAGKASGISLNVLEELCHAMDNKTDALEQSLLFIYESLDKSQEVIQRFRRDLSALQAQESK